MDRQTDERPLSPRFTFYHGTIAYAKREHLTKIDVQRIRFSNNETMDCSCHDYHQWAQKVRKMQLLTGIHVRTSPTTEEGVGERTRGRQIRLNSEIRLFAPHQSNCHGPRLSHDYRPSIYRLDTVGV